MCGTQAILLPLQNHIAILCGDDAFLRARRQASARRQTGTGVGRMSGKKGRAFFICPRWSEVADAARQPTSGTATSIDVDRRTLAAIKEGRPVARSTLRKALLAARQASGSTFDVNAYMVDRRTVAPR